MNERPRILYCGVPIGAEMLRRHGHAPVALALGPLDMPGRARLRRRLPSALHLDLPDLNATQTEALILERRPDVLLSFFWPRKIPASLLTKMPLGAYGTHPSLLPRWRGPDPYFWALRAGDRETGVTLHVLEPSYDTGAVVATRTLATAELDAWGLAKALDRPAIALLRWAADQLKFGALPATPQVGPVSWAGRPKAEDLHLRWERSVSENLALVRAAAPEPGAQALLGDRPVEIVRACAETERPPMGLRVAEAWCTERGDWAVRCGHGALRLLAVRDAEGCVHLNDLFE